MHYRIHILDGRLEMVRGHDLMARDDVTALEHGIGLSAASPIEIWQKHRLVARIGLSGEAIADRPDAAMDRAA